MTFNIDDSKTVYAKNEEGNRIYKVASFDAYDNTETLILNLELVCGLKDGIWMGADEFPEDEGESFNQFFLSEGTEETLIANDYTIVKTLPEF